MTERVVDSLEVVQIHAEQGKTLAPGDLGKSLLHALAVENAVREPGQGVVMGQVR